MMAKQIKRKPFHPFEESILRTLNKSRRELTPTQIARKIGIHPVTAKNRINILTRKRLIKCATVGKRRYCKINRKKFKL